MGSFDEHMSNAATCSDELTCCNARHGTATADTSNAKQPRISQGVITKNSYLRIYVCHSMEVLNTVYKLTSLLH